MVEEAPPARMLAHAAGMTIAAHAHLWGQLGVVLRGTMAIQSAAGRWLAPQGRGLWVPAGVEHAVEYSEESRLVLVDLPPGIGQGAVPRSLAVAPLLRELALALASPPAAALCAPLLAELLTQELARPAEAGGLFVPFGQDPRLRRAVAQVLAAPGDNVTLAALAARAGASPRTLARLFEAQTGMGFTRWREHLRANLGLDRLLRGQSITSVALALGYASPAAFTTMFTRLRGQPPSRLLKQMRGEASPPLTPSPPSATGAP